MSGPLEGLRIIDVCRTRPGQHATSILADYGAHCITVVEPGYAERRLQHGWANAERVKVNTRNKRSMFLNLKQPGARDVLLQLVKVSDGFLESNRPGVMKKLGLDYEALQAVNPSVVYCSLSGFGQYGPYSDIGAHDLSYQAVAGVIPMDKDGKPYLPPYNYADLNAAWRGAMAMLMAFFERTRSGKGQYLDISFCDVTVHTPPGGMAEEGIYGEYPSHNIYETQDGEYLTISTREGWYWDRLCNLVGRPDWMPHIRAEGAVRDEMFEGLRAYFKSKPLAELINILHEADIQFGPVNRTVEQMQADPHLKAREMMVEVINPLDGQKQLKPGFAFKFSRTPARLTRQPSLMGCDTEAVLKELGYGDSAIAELRAQGAI